MHANLVGTSYTSSPGLRLLQFSVTVAAFTRAGFSPFFSLPKVPLGLICIISPKSAACYDGITLHDGWIWAKAAVRTGYLANVLSRPCLGTRETERVGGGERDGEENRIGKRGNGETQSQRKSLLALK